MKLENNLSHVCQLTIGESRGAPAYPPPPQGDIIPSFLGTFCRKVTVSDVGTAPIGSVLPQREIQDTSLINENFRLRRFVCLDFQFKILKVRKDVL